MTGRPTNSERRAMELRRALGQEIRTIRQDAAVTTVRLAAAANVSRSHLAEIESGTTDPSSEVLVRLADALGANVSVRLYPGTGSRLRDHIQATITEALLRRLHPRWSRFAEVPVYRPVRGVVDIVLHDPTEQLVLAAEIHSQLRRLEQIVRWSNEKRDALPSADFWAFAASSGAPSRASLLIIRSTRTNRAVVDSHATLLGAAYPARAADAMAALCGPATWPGNAIIWARVERGQAELLDKPPRGVALGR